MQYPPVFVKVRKLLEPLAVRLGDRRLKAACCELVVDSGDGRHAARALANLRAVEYRLGDIDDAKRLLSSQLAAMGVA
jgi:hypothetical protein